jgi:hypothetical protein
MSTKKPVRVTRTDKQPAPERVRRLGRALIALARAQLEADAQAQAGAGEQGDRQAAGIEPRTPSKTPPDTGDAA